MTCKKYLLAAKRAPLFVLFWQMIGFAFGLVMVLVINAFINDEKTYICLGSAMSCIGFAFVIVQSNLGGATRYRLAVTMGMTRRSYLLWDTLITALLAGQAFLTGWLLSLAEGALFDWLYPDYTMEINFARYIFNWKVILGVVLLLMALQLFSVGIIQRFGQKGFLTAWVILWGISMFLPQSIGLAQSGKTSLLAQGGRFCLWVAGLMSPVAWACGGMAALTAAALAGVRWLWRAEVRL